MTDTLFVTIYFVGGTITFVLFSIARGYYLEKRYDNKPSAPIYRAIYNIGLTMDWAGAIMASMVWLPALALSLVALPFYGLYIIAVRVGGSLARKREGGDNK